MNRDRIYQISHWVGLGLFGLLLAMGTIESIRSHGRLPGISLRYGTYIYEHVERNEYKAAVRQMRIAIEINATTRAELNVELAQLAKQHGDLETMISALMDARAIRPFPDVYLYNDLSYGLLALNRNSNDIRFSMQIAIEGLSVSPDYAPLHCNLGVAAYQLGDREQSARHFQTALRFDPDLEQAQAGVKLLQGEQP